MNNARHSDMIRLVEVHQQWREPWLSNSGHLKLVVPETLGHGGDLVRGVECLLLFDFHFQVLARERINKWVFTIFSGWHAEGYARPAGHNLLTNHVREKPLNLRCRWPRMTGYGN